MNNNLIEIVFILDRSGSMSGLKSDTIGGFNGYIEKQKQLDGEAKLTTVLFDDKYEILHNGVNIRDIEPLTDEQYYVRGSTALLDAIGKTINDVGDRLSNTAEADRPAKVLFVITTDGLENASVEFTAEQIKSMITRQTDVYNWEFIFLGANIDSISTAASYGISAQNAKNYTANSIGTQSIYAAVTNGTTKLRGKMSGAGGQSVAFDASDLDEVQ